MKQIEGEVKNIGVDTRIGIEVEAAKEKMLLSASSGSIIAESLEMPQIQAEIDRAVWQVERAIKAQEDKDKKEKTEAADQKPEQRR